ncbi:MAG: penicillin-binding protein 1C [Elusimicrobiaceae bacterium]|nr:penicillin-binding protein 1C [Elusimicrobiaceae bacterium]
MKPPAGRKTAVLCAAAGIFLSAAALFIWPARPAPPPGPADYSVTVAAAGGEPLRRYLSAAGCYSAPVKLADVPAWALLAFLAAEDRRFLEHPGVDVRAIARALWQNARAGKTVSGASTITQQLARAITPRERTVPGKLREMARALWLERGMTKQEILQRYLNTVNFSNNAAGIGAASELFFELAPQRLTLSQSAFLAGIPQSPSRYDPVRHYAQALRRRDAVLGRMLAAGYIDRALYESALSEKIIIRKRSAGFFAPQFCDFALRRYAADARGRRPPDGKIRTSIDFELQRGLERAVGSYIKKLRDKNVTNAALVALDNKTGGVLAWVGSADYFSERNSGQVDGVTALRQPGSALKPFVYGLALERGWRASDRLADSPAVFAHGFSPENYDRRFHGPVSVRQALACSYNIPAVYLAEQLGPDAVLKTLHDFGFDSLRLDARHYGAGLSLGNGEVTLLELANAYAALARGGEYLPWSVFGRRAGLPRRALDARAAYIITDILSDNHAREAAFSLDSPFNMPFPFAAKTGTSKDYKDNWAVGYTPGWTVAVWAGNFDASPMRRVSGVTGAGPLLRLAAFMLQRRYPSGGFARPAGLAEAEICPDSGRAAGHFCPATANELFYASRLPEAGCPVHKPEGMVTPARAFVKTVSVSFPKDGDVFVLEPAYPAASQEIKLQAATPCSAPVQWRVDGAAVSSSAGQAWWGLKPGAHSVYFTQECGGKTVKTRPARFRVIGYGEPVPEPDPGR